MFNVWDYERDDKFTWQQSDCLGKLECGLMDKCKGFAKRSEKHECISAFLLEGRVVL
jgi:hypothetical protein